MFLHNYFHLLDCLHGPGPIVRISPHELHVSDPAFYDKLYRMDGRWDKYAWMYNAFGAPQSTLFAVGMHHSHIACLK